jgi:hypothetical protein
LAASATTVMPGTALRVLASSLACRSLPRSAVSTLAALLSTLLLADRADALAAALPRRRSVL